MLEPSSTPSKIGTRKAITIAKTEKVFKRGTLMFIEGDSSTEMYIIRRGKVRILKQEGDKSIELAVLGPGAVLGELALLDHQPRSATAQVIEDTEVTVIDEEQLQHTLNSIPSWLTNIVLLIIKRLRDTMKKVSEEIIIKNIAGVVRILLLLYNNERSFQQQRNAVPLKRVIECVYNCIGLSTSETESVLMHLILRELIYIRKNQTGEEFVIIKDAEVLQLYLSYLRCKQHHGTLLGEKLSDVAVEFLRDIQLAGEKNAKKIKDSIYQLSIQQLEIELERMGKSRNINLGALDELVQMKILIKEEDVTESNYGTHKRTLLIYNLEIIRRILMLHQWLAIFKEEVQL